ncbi:UROD/MetE-like protein [Phanerochaete sordida]|uniref:UROD/MetE-like protein n=1 Tax=Phanerochaete sordida TaxID=48140 RepID=A0A9P3G272_9APHY|nr:UROD/MetE-like protein [Phanerochaete sordida]
MFANTTDADSFLHINPPFRAEHIGSLLRPSYLLEQRARFQAGTCTAEELRATEDAAIAAAVKVQQSAGLQTITDGEMRRGAFYEGIFERLDGMSNLVRPIETFKAYLPYVQFFIKAGLKEVPSMYCTGRIRRPEEGVYVRDFEYLTSLVPPQDVGKLKVSVCGPTWMHLRHGPESTYDTAVYATDDAYFADLVQGYREELRALYAAGCRNIQFDDPTFAFFCADSTIKGMEKAGVDWQQLLDMYIQVYNSILQERPADLTIGLHTCRGNYQGMHYCEGGYDRIAKKLFNELRVDCYYLEYDTERAGDLEPLKNLPQSKMVVLGLVTTKTGELESIEELQDAIDEAADLIAQGSPKRSRAYALNQICISPQCGFASVAEGNPITEEEQRAKLALVVEAARKILE